MNILISIYSIILAITHLVFLYVENGIFSLPVSYILPLIQILYVFFVAQLFYNLYIITNKKEIVNANSSIVKVCFL